MLKVQKVFLSAVICFGGLVSVAGAEDLQKIEGEVAKLYAKHLTELFQKDIKDAAVKFDVDADLASGVHAGQDGILMVPMKGLKEGEINPDVEKEHGAGLCYLFLSKCYQPMLDGKPIDASKLLSIKHIDGSGESREAFAVIITVKHVDGDDWRLFVYGKEKQPLLKQPFGAGSGDGTGLVELKADAPQNNSSNLTFVIAQKYAASFAISAK